MKLNFAENLRNLRREKNLTQEQLAGKLGITFQSVSRWETGATYPDIELLPVLADIFEVTVDDLLGVDRQVREAPQRYYDRLNSLSDEKARLALLREVHRDYPKDWNMFRLLCGTTDDLNEQRELTAELLETCPEAWHREEAISYMIKSENDQKILDDFLDKHTTERNMSRERLLEERYCYRKEWDSYEIAKQKIALESIEKGLFGRLVSGFPPKIDIRESLWGSTCKLALINLLTGNNGENFVAGDGVPDLWFESRFHAGIRYSCQLASTGEISAALNALEEVTSLFEKFYSLPDGTILTYRCPAFDRLFATVHVSMMRGPEAGEEWHIKHSVRLVNNKELRIYQMHWPHIDIWPLVKRTGWEWFDPIRDHPRFGACLERMQMYLCEEIED